MQICFYRQGELWYNGRELERRILKEVFKENSVILKAKSENVEEFFKMY